MFHAVYSHRQTFARISRQVLAQVDQHSFAIEFDTLIEKRLERSFQSDICPNHPIYMAARQISAALFPLCLFANNFEMFAPSSGSREKNSNAKMVANCFNSSAETANRNPVREI